MERGARVSEKNNYQNNIKHFRVREGLTQEELAKKINTSRQMIGLIENSKTIPSVEIALKLAKVLKEPKRWGWYIYPTRPFSFIFYSYR